MLNRRKFFSGSIFHVFNRGSKKELIFYGNNDYQRFIEKLFFYANQTKDHVIQYCLLPNHFHFLIKANSVDSISKLMLKLQKSHARYYCYEFQQVGRIFQGKYKSILVDSRLQLMTVSRYIHRNPIDYFQSEQAINDYPWSSYPEFILGSDGLVKTEDKQIILSEFSSIAAYEEFVCAEELVVQKIIKAEARII